MRSSLVLFLACMVTAGAAVNSARASIAYLTNARPPNGDNSLREWHVGTTLTTRIGGTGLSSQLTGLAWDSAHGIMYGIEQLSAQLCTVDLATGHATLIGSTGMSPAQGLAINPATGVLYGVAGGGGGAGAGQLFSVDPMTGLGTPIGGPSGRPIGGLTFAPDGRLLGCVVGPAGGGLYAIDVATGAQSLVYTCPSLSGIAFDPADSQMYGIDNFTGNAYQIDFASGAFTTIGRFNFTDLPNPKALVFVPGPGGVVVLMIGAGGVAAPLGRRRQIA